MDKFRNIVASVFQIDSEAVQADLSPMNVSNWDSLGQLELILSLEAAYRVQFELEDVLRIFTISDILQLLQNKGVNLNGKV